MCVLKEVPLEWSGVRVKIQELLLPTRLQAALKDSEHSATHSKVTSARDEFQNCAYRPARAPSELLSYSQQPTSRSNSSSVQLSNRLQLSRAAPLPALQPAAPHRPMGCSALILRQLSLLNSNDERQPTHVHNSDAACTVVLRHSLSRVSFIASPRACSLGTFQCRAPCGMTEPVQR